MGTSGGPPPMEPPMVAPICTRRVQATRRPSEQATTEASKRASEANKRASERANQRASERTSEQASKRASDQMQTTHKQQQTTNSKQQATSSKQQTTSNQPCRTRQTRYNCGRPKRHGGGICASNWIEREKGGERGRGSKATKQAIKRSFTKSSLQVAKSPSLQA